MAKQDKIFLAMEAPMKMNVHTHGGVLYALLFRRWYMRLYVAIGNIIVQIYIRPTLYSFTSCTDHVMIVGGIHCPDDYDFD